jgi:Kef-type K+ transport system membrane component KefB
VIPLLLLFALGGLMHAARSFAPHLAIAGTELAFGYLLLTAYFAAKVISRLGLPRLTGYILAGVVTGPFVLDLVSHPMTAQLKVVNGVAVCLLGLTAGSELKLRLVRPLMRTLRAITWFAVLGSMVAIAAVLFLMRPLLPFLDAMTFTQALVVCLLIGVALSAQSPAVVMALVSETAADGPLTRVMLASVVVADLVVITCFSVVSALAGSVIGDDIDLGRTALSVMWELVGSAGFGVAIGMLLGAFVRYVQGGASLFAIMVCVVVAEIGGRIHLDPLIVMLAAGIWLENYSRTNASALLQQFESAQLPVFLVFFALAGAKLDLGSLYHSIIPVAVLALARGTSFYLGARTACRRTEAPAVVTQYAWFAMVPQAGLALALALLLQKTFPTFGDGAAVLLFGVVAVNELIAPVVLKRLLLRSGEAGKRTPADFASGH